MNCETIAFIISVSFCVINLLFFIKNIEDRQLLNSERREFLLEKSLSNNDSFLARNRYQKEIHAQYREKAKKLLERTRLFLESKKNN